MIKINMDRLNLLRDSEEYEEYTENEAKLSGEEKEALGIKSCTRCCKTRKK